MGSQFTQKAVQNKCRKPIESNKSRIGVDIQSLANPFKLLNNPFVICDIYWNLSDWWFQTLFVSPECIGIISPTDFHIFQDGWNHQPIDISYKKNIVKLMSTSMFMLAGWKPDPIFTVFCWCTCEPFWCYGVGWGCVVEGDSLVPGKKSWYRTAGHQLGPQVTPRRWPPPNPDRDWAVRQDGILDRGEGGPTRKLSNPLAGGWR